MTSFESEYKNSLVKKQWLWEILEIFMGMSKNILSSDHGPRLFHYLRDGKINGVVGIFWSWIKGFLIIQHAAWACDFRIFLDPSESGDLSVWHHLKVDLRELSWEWGNCEDSWTLELWLLDLGRPSYLGMKFNVHTPNHLEVWQRYIVRSVHCFDQPERRERWSRRRIGHQL